VKGQNERGKSANQTKIKKIKKNDSIKWLNK
jgi:hypothetical protein